MRPVSLAPGLPPPGPLPPTIPFPSDQWSSRAERLADAHLVNEGISVRVARDDIEHQEDGVSPLLHAHILAKLWSCVGTGKVHDRVLGLSARHTFPKNTAKQVYLENGAESSTVV